MARPCEQERTVSKVKVPLNKFERSNTVADDCVV